MELVSASKMGKAEQQSRAYEPYRQKMQEVVTHIAQSNDENDENKITHPMLNAREVNKTGYIVITSDRGLAGAFNSNILRHLHQTIEERHSSPDEYTIIAVGRIGFEFCNKRNLPVSQSILGISDHPTFADIHELASETVQMYIEEEIDELVIFYNHYVSPISQKATNVQLLPITNIEEQETANEFEYEYEPNQERILEVL